MEEIKAQIDAIVNSLNFERRQPVTATQKAAYGMLQKDVADVLKNLNHLHLSLWNGTSHHDYHSLPLDKVKEKLVDITAQIQAIIDKN